jgi:outer membrane lipoprotein SlyB
MISFAPATPAQTRRFILAQAVPPAPAPVPVPVQSSPLVNLIGWTVLGMAAGAVSGYAVGKGLGKRNTPFQDAVIGGIGGGAATLLSRIL